MNSNGYNTYHTLIKTSYALGIESELLPEHFTKSIPRSTSQGWRELDPSDFVGSEFAHQVEVDLQQVKLLLDKRIERLRIAFQAFARLYLTILDFIKKENFEKLILQNREVVVDIVENLPAEINRKLVCKFLQLSEHQFKIWKYNRKFRCSFSLIGYCSKRFPTQISQKEINVLKSLMYRRRFATWSVAAIWGYAFKKGYVSMSRTTWYRYCLKLNISTKRKPPKLKRKRGSVDASVPNEIWHMDVTEYMTKDYRKFYIHTVIDNFSRKILAYTISRDKTAKTRLISLRDAIQSQFDTSLTQETLDLIVDGGPENNNFRINNFIRHCHVGIHKKIALKEVRFSNAIVEGNFKMLKSFLRKRGDIFSNTIHKEINFFVRDHNEHKPFYKYQIHTPDEIHSNPALVDVKPMLQRANRERLIANRISCCKETLQKQV